MLNIHWEIKVWTMEKSRMNMDFVRNLMLIDRHLLLMVAVSFGSVFFQEETEVFTHNLSEMNFKDRERDRFNRRFFCVLAIGIRSKRHNCGRLTRGAFPMKTFNTVGWCVITKHGNGGWHLENCINQMNYKIFFSLPCMRSASGVK